MPGLDRLRSIFGLAGLGYEISGRPGRPGALAPHRVVRFFLSRDVRRVERHEVVEANNPLFDEPTLGALVGDTFYYVANSQWGAVDRKGRLAPAEKLRDPVILKVKL
jgi:hypothetical protein